MTQPLCHYCGKPIAKSTKRVSLTLKRQDYQKDSDYWRYIEVLAFPASKAECQALTNWTVTSVSYGAHTSTGYDKAKIASFKEWDGKSYQRAFFCKNACAEDFGCMAVRAGYTTKRHRDALLKQQGEKVDAA